MYTHTYIYKAQASLPWSLHVSTYTYTYAKTGIAALRRGLSINIDFSEGEDDEEPHFEASAAGVLLALCVESTDRQRIGTKGGRILREPSTRARKKSRFHSPASSPGKEAREGKWGAVKEERGRGGTVREDKVKVVPVRDERGKGVAAREEKVESPEYESEKSVTRKCAGSDLL
jgi:hypothetical protein